MGTPPSPAVGLVVIVVGLVIYFLPTIIGWCRDKAHGGLGVFLLNLCLGWTLVGWVAAFIWASSGKTKGELRLEERRHRELLAAVRSKVSP